jgi:hypothetical protein
VIWREGVSSGGFRDSERGPLDSTKSGDPLGWSASAWGLSLCPSARCAHLIVATGKVNLEEVGPLEKGDAARLTDGGQRDIIAGALGAEILIWESGKS